MSTLWEERPTVDIDVKTPRLARQTQLYDRTGECVAELISAIRREFIAPSPWLLRAAHLIDARTQWRFHARAIELGRTYRIDWRELFLAAVSYDYALSVFGCSTAAVATAEGPVLARNMDWWPERELARSSFLFRELDSGIPQTVVAGWPGELGAVTGMSVNGGFAVAMNAVTSPEPMRKTGYPVMLFLRRVLETASSFENAVNRLSRQRLASGCLLTVVGTRNDQRVCIERTPTRAVRRFPEGDSPLVTTNEYRELGCDSAIHQLEQQLLETSCRRYDALTHLLNGSPDYPDEFLLYSLSDADVRLAITAQHVIMRPHASTARLFVPSRLLSN